MPLRTLQPNPSVADRIASEVRGLARRPDLVALSLRDSVGRSLGMAAPHPVFNLGLDALESVNWTNRVEMTGWRYFVTSRTGVVAAAEASSDSANGPIKGTMTNTGPFVAGTESALAVVESDPRVAKGKFVLGMLRVPALYVVALWLRGEGKSEGEDWIVPVDPAPEPLRPEVLIHPEDFLEALVKLRDRRGATADATSASPSN